MRHIFFLLAILQFTLIACNNKPSESAYSLRDSVLEKYFELTDSSEQIDTSDFNYKILKAYISDDTIFFKKFNTNIDNYQKWVGDSCIHQKKLKDLNADEAYRFIYSEAFCPYELNVTVSNKSDSSTLHFILYQIDTPCYIVSEYEKALTKKNWEGIQEAINGADFWGLKRSNGVRVLDGSSLEVYGFTKGYQTAERKPKSNYVHRCGNTTLYDPLDLVLKLSGNTQGCLVIK